MKNTQQKTRQHTITAIKIAATWLSVFALSILIIEIFLFGFIGRRSSATVAYYFDRGSSIFFQYSKRSDTPKDYIAIFGDSYAEGQGDWFFDNQFSRFPDTQASHVLYKKTGKDVATFGFANSGSIDAYLVHPSTIMHYIKSLWFYDMENPEIIFLYFYEGNDIIDNYRDYKTLRNTTALSSEVIDPDTLEKAVYQHLIPQNPVETAARENTLRKNLLFTRYFIFAAQTTWQAIKNGSYRSGVPPRPPQQTNPDTRVLIAGQPVSIPKHLQTAPLDYPKEQMTIALDIFTSSIQLVAKQYPHAKIGVVYIPSPASSYQFDSGKIISDSDKLQREFDPATLASSSDMLCEMIQSRTINSNLFFHDIRHAIREASANHLLHGPNDWNHFSEYGYKTLANELLALMQHMNTADEGDNRSLLSSPCAAISQDSPKAVLN